MALSVAESLLAKNGFHAEDMAERFADRYYLSFLNRKDRCYGSFVPYVFKQFKEKKYEDIFDPARKQFSGMGSLGNGAAMRTYPVALFCHNKSRETLFKICVQTAQLTHASIDGYNGAVLQTLAVKFALDADPESDFDRRAFLELLETTMAELESERPPNPEFPSFCVQIKNMKSFLEKPHVDPSEVGKELGNEETANFSVPSAIYCFLRAQEPIPEYETDNPFLRTLYLAVALGGDTDTIATMACSVAGAFYGASSIPKVLYEQCEDWSTFLKLADQLAKLVDHTD